MNLRVLKCIPWYEFGGEVYNHSIWDIENVWKWHFNVIIKGSLHTHILWYVYNLLFNQKHLWFLFKFYQIYTLNQIQQEIWMIFNIMTIQNAILIEQLSYRFISYKYQGTIIKYHFWVKFSFFNFWEFWSCLKGKKKLNIQIWTFEYIVVLTTSLFLCISNINEKISSYQRIFLFLMLF
jgi:hypothetical protein